MSSSNQTKFSCTFVVYDGSQMQFVFVLLAELNLPVSRSPELRKALHLLESHCTDSSEGWDSFSLWL